MVRAAVLAWCGGAAAPPPGLMSRARLRLWRAAGCAHDAAWRAVPQRADEEDAEACARPPPSLVCADDAGGQVIKVLYPGGFRWLHDAWLQVSLLCSASCAACLAPGAPPPLPASFAPPCLLHLLLLKARRKLLFHGAKAPCLLTSARAAPVGLWGAGLGGLWGAGLRGGQVPPALLTVRHAKNCNFGLNNELLRLDGAAPPLPADVGLDLQGAAGGLPPPPLCGASCLLFGRPSVRAMA